MRIALTNAFLGLLAAMSVGCSTLSGPTYSETPKETSTDQATVVVYRFSSLKGIVWDHPIYLDGQLVANLSAGGFTRFAASPGMHQVSTGPKSNPTYLVVNMTVSAGETYFIEDRPGMNLSTPDRFMIIDAAVAEKRLSNYRYQASLPTSQE